ncbi:MAG TPA: RtcB family protein [Planctomycetaceae bacterium]|nr:RtcB family protein [Planctomycetaceae bacterium]
MSENSVPCPVEMWLAEPPSTEVQRVIDRLRRLPDARQLAVLPDVHLAADVCVGIALATADCVYPAAVGGDIGCGMLAVAVNADAEFLASPERAADILSELYDRIPANKHRFAQDLPPELRDAALSCDRLERLKRRDGAVQLGTLGRGNHFVELQRDGENRLWLMIHSGSRGLGQAITEHHQRQCTDRGGLHGLIADEATGQAYLHDVAWARRYAVANRLGMAQAVEALIQTHDITLDWSTLIHCDHNHVAREMHRGEWVWVHRKGAMPAEDDQPGMIPGSMGTSSVHVIGRGCDAALRTCSHGAGRKLTRTAARQRSRRDLFRQMGHIWFDRRYADDLREEAPSAYKDLRTVLRAQRDLIRIVRELHPVLVYKGR